MINDKTAVKETVVEKPIKLKGKYISAIGRRKAAGAQVRLYKKGTGIFIINEEKISRYLNVRNAAIASQALKLTGHLKDINISVIATGGGKKGQAEAIRHGITRALIELNEDLKPALKAKGWVTRDARRKERKKPGLKKARRAPQWSKR